MDEAVTLAFGRFELSVHRRRLLRDGEPIVLGTRAFDLLVALVERRDRIVTKSELLDIVWPGLVVEENNLQVQIGSLRKVLGPQAIATIPGRGYRFTASLDTLPIGGSPRTGNAHAQLTCNIPEGLPRLIGREAEVIALGSLIEAHRLVTVVGAAGIGKSRLAQASARSQTEQWADGVWWVELASQNDPEHVPGAVAQVLNMPMTGQSPALDDLVAYLSRRTLLLAIDNCEHLIDGVRSLIQAIVKGAPRVTVLATSREPLHLPAEQQYRVEPLAVPSEPGTRGARDFGAIALFEDRVRAVAPAFALNKEHLAVAIDICRRLDGLPLAIELAAARVGTLGLRQVRDKLRERFELLAGGSHAALDRHKTLNKAPEWSFELLAGGSHAALDRHKTLSKALEWSYQLLSDGEQTVFRRLAVFVGDFTMAMAQAVVADSKLDEWSVLEHLSALVNKSLVVANLDSGRYRLLDSIRCYARKKLGENKEVQDLRHRHSQAILSLIQGESGRWTVALDSEHNWTIQIR